MPGNVLGVRVKEGDAVEAGQVLVVLEAMKMENNVPSPAAGTVARVLIAPGQQVQRAQTLVELA
jgi:biotin carboxyl carrier protein